MNASNVLEHESRCACKSLALPRDGEGLAGASSNDKVN